MSKNLKLKKVDKSFVLEPTLSVFGFPKSISRIHILVDLVDPLCMLQLSLYRDIDGAFYSHVPLGCLQMEVFGHVWYSSTGFLLITENLEHIVLLIITWSFKEKKNDYRMER